MSEMNDLNLLEQELNELVFTIEDEGVREFTLEMLKVAPRSFWEARASREHHPTDERLPGGNLLHVIRMVKLLGMICECCEVEGYQRDLLNSAGILHDLCRNRKDGSLDYTADEHPFLVRELAKDHGINYPCGPVIFKLIESHMGKWGKVPTHPVITGTTAIHLADAISARADQVWEELAG